MDNTIYEAAWEAIEPIFEEYLRGDGRFQFATPRTQENFNEVHAKLVALRDDALAPYGVNIDDLEDEAYRRLDASK